MVPLLLISAAVWYGFWARRERSFMDSRMSPRKVVETLKDSHNKLVSETPFSLNQEDRLSELPDEILSCILSHLTLRDVGRTTTLSRRWRNMWLALRKLDLDWCAISGYKGLFHMGDCELHKQAYVKRVDQVLRQCEKLDISSFRISFCFTKQFASDVDKWIGFASKKHLESLTLQFICIDHYASKMKLKLQKRLEPVHWYIITSSFLLSQFARLINLRLDSCILKLHNGFRLNKLVSLDLNYVVLDPVTHLQWMLSNSSTIERLRFRNCNLPGKLCIGENLQRLSSLVINHCSELQEIEFNANNLRTFEYSGQVAVKCFFVSAAKLENCYVYLLDKEFRGAECIFSELSSVKTLALKGLVPWIHELPTHPPTILWHVVRLSLFFQKDPDFGLIRVLPHLLKCFPLLQKLYLMVPFTFHPIKDELLPAVYLHLRLKEVELGNFQMNWVPCASYLLKSTAVLDRMLINRHIKSYIDCGDWDSHETRFFFFEKERKYIRSALQGIVASPSADLIIY